jgi:hypothetical protein
VISPTVYVVQWGRLLEEQSDIPLLNMAKVAAKHSTATRMSQTPKLQIVGFCSSCKERRLTRDDLN